MKVTDLFEAKRAETDKGYYVPGYDAELKRVVGTVTDWLARLKVTPRAIEAAVIASKHLPAFVELTNLGLTFKSTPRQLENGTFVFSKPDAKNDDQYLVYANGLIRSSAKGNWGEIRPTRLKSPKPRLVAGDPIGSLINIYNGAFTELVSKVKKASKAVKEAVEPKKQFKIKWISGYGEHDGKSKVFDFDDIAGDFSDEDLEKIKGLAIGDEMSTGGPMDSVTVTRTR